MRKDTARGGVINKTKDRKAGAMFYLEQEDPVLPFRKLLTHFAEWAVDAWSANKFDLVMDIAGVAIAAGGLVCIAVLFGLIMKAAGIK